MASTAEITSFQSQLNRCSTLVGFKPLVISGKLDIPTMKALSLTMLRVLDLEKARLSPKIGTSQLNSFLVANVQERQELEGWSKNDFTLGEWRFVVGPQIKQYTSRVKGYADALNLQAGSTDGPRPTAGPALNTTILVLGGVVVAWWLLGSGSKRGGSRRR